MAAESFRELQHPPIPSDDEVPKMLISSKDKIYNSSANYNFQNEFKLTRFCMLCGLITSLTSFIAGYKLAELNNPKKSIMSCNKSGENEEMFRLPLCLPMSEVYFGFVTSVLALGGLIGSILSGKLADSLGRKKSLILNSSILFVGSILETFAYSPFMLVLGRFLSGIGAGIGFVIVPMYLTEIAPIKSRGFLNMFNTVGAALGTFVSQVLGHFLNTDHGWRVVLGSGIFMSVFSGITLLYIVESPRYLYINNHKNESKFSLKKLRGMDNVEFEFNTWGHSIEKTNEEINGNDLHNLNSSIEQRSIGKQSFWCFFCECVNKYLE
ncbi:Vacuolar protein sorting-associated protein 73 [Smittium mucronatum]|uniref:Vacuolar protein sorting-associated protein 73 n=1 Tax=Smittium mucronatum TaxID=133383 RepID=A0A1R0H8M2_9FUNG|nr:Vacuolar protein sorting-associated protein 73 [Smittium mucronatum]